MIKPERRRQTHPVFHLLNPLLYLFFLFFFYNFQIKSTGGDFTFTNNHTIDKITPGVSNSVYFFDVLNKGKIVIFLG